MKYLVLLSLLLAPQAWARQEGGKEVVGVPRPGSAKQVSDAQRIYESLAVDEENLSPPGLAGSYTFGKAVGGLECTRGGVVYPGATPDFTCSLAERNNDRAIYNRLAVKEVNRSEGDGYAVWEKYIGNLRCRKVAAVTRQPRWAYHCQLE